jgi:SAM-dependent methyltransferase
VPREGGLSCARCGTVYSAGERQVDLRPRTHKRLDLPVLVRPLDEISQRRRHPRPIPLNPAGLTDVDPGGLVWGNGLTRELMSWFPRADEKGGTLLDMGCGSRRCEQALRLTGYEYVGLDIGGDTPDVLGIGEALPFRDASFDFVFTLSVVPHTSRPELVMRELYRVLKPGCRFIGTAEFLEPCHEQSRHHVTALGVQDWLDNAGFELLHLETNEGWLVTDALLYMGFLPRLGPRSRRRIARVVRAAANAMQNRNRDAAAPIGEGYPEKVTGGFRFVARRPA